MVDAAAASEKRTAGKIISGVSFTDFFTANRYDVDTKRVIATMISERVKMTEPKTEILIS